MSGGQIRGWPIQGVGLTSVAEVRLERRIGPVGVLQGPPPAPTGGEGSRTGDIVARAVVHGVLRSLHDGRLHLVEGGHTRSYGPVGGGVAGDGVAGDGAGGDGKGADPLESTVQVVSPRAYSALVTERSVGLGRGYFEGWWDCDDLVSLIRTLLRLARPLERRSGGLARVSAPLLDRMGRLRHGEDKERDRSFISAHYDLGNELFATFLDETMMYSCAVFAGPDTTLAQASAAKLDHLCIKLNLRAGQRVVEIGGGWGGFAVHAATHYGVHVTTTTISARQYQYMLERVHAAGLDDRVTVLKSDYRDLDGDFDALVSIEMIEAVDWRDHDTFFGTCSRLLSPGGLMGLQAIVIDDGSFERAKHAEDFLKRFIFPGSCIPSVGAIMASAGGAGSLRLVDLEDIGRHYAETLARWRVAFDAAGEEHRRMGLDERFRRLWDFYLAYCEAGFLEAHVSDVQLVLAKPGWRAPLATRGR